MFNYRTATEDRKPDPELKGKREGNCNRTACQRPLLKGRTWFNRVTRAYYCQHCAFLINDANTDVDPPYLSREPLAGRDIE